MSTAPLMSATQEELVERINHEAAKIQSLNATVDIQASVGGAKKGKVTDYTGIQGYVLVRKPRMLRMIGLLPVVRSKAFDMVSNGNEFKLSIPPKNRFVVGHNEIVKPSANALENLRPQHIYDALLLHEIRLDDQIAVLENSTERVVDANTKKIVEQPNYVVDVIQRAEQGWFLSRKIFFDRSDLVPHRQVVYDKLGNVATDATYQVFRDYNSVSFPSVIQIWRPQEEYRITLVIQKLTVNQPLTEQQFALNQPPGSQLINLDQQHATQNASSGAASSNNNSGDEHGGSPRE